MRAHFSNSAYGVIDYVAQPVGMIVAAPILLHHLGLAPYGLWLVASAAVSAGSILSSGFGDAVIQRVASLRASDDRDGIRRVIANLLATNLLLSGALASLVWLGLPFMIASMTHGEPALRLPCLWSLRIGAVLIVVKSVESVFVSAQRAYERYGPAVRIAVATRLLGIAVSVVLALEGFGVVALMISAGVLTTLGALTQWAALRRHLGAGLLRPSLDRGTWSQIASFGVFSWLQASSGVIFSQADRLILAAMLGAPAVAYYSVCVQMTQPIHGLTAAGLHFLFPHLASRFRAGAAAEIRRPVLAALAVNVVAAAALTIVIGLCGQRVLALWMGAAFAEHSEGLLPLLAVAFGLLGLNVTAHYTLLALGRVRLVAAVAIAGGVLMLLVMPMLIRERGVQGAALARLCYGPLTWLLYLPLIALFGARVETGASIAPVRVEQA